MIESAIAAPVAIADTSGLLAFFDQSEPEHKGCRAAMATLSHAVISPMVLAELDYLLTTGISADAAEQALDYVIGQSAIERFEVPDIGPELAAAQVVMRRHSEIGLTDAMNVALAATFRTNVILTLDRKHFRALRPLFGEKYFRLLPDDL
ncbi:PIN domain-containing protein [Microlunatus sp. GCM10028923]|uniref:PIN domain-containing protein n=1 Tax=Microlunatus sp. GCM10028923 TaxID=3273400 RepID=UPI00360F0B9F